MICNKIVFFLLLTNLAIANGTAAALGASANNLTAELDDSKQKVIVYKQKLQTLYDALKIPQDANTARTCVLDKIEKIRNVLSLFKKMSYFPKVQTGATSLDKLLEKFETSFETKTTKVPTVAATAKTLETVPVTKFIENVDPLVKKINASVSKVQALNDKASLLQEKLISFPDKQAAADQKMQDIADKLSKIASLVGKVTQSLDDPVTRAHKITTDIEPFVTLATSLSDALTVTCSTVTSNDVFKMIGTLSDWINADYCIDSSDKCVGGNEVFSRTCDFTQTVCVGPYSVPQACLEDVVTLKVCLIPKELLEKKLCGTVPNKCVSAPSPINQEKCFSDLGIPLEVCTDTNFASLVMDKLEEYLPKWEIDIPFTGADTNFTDADFGSLQEPTLEELDNSMASLPEIIVNDKFNGGLATVTDNSQDGSQTIKGDLGVIVADSESFTRDPNIMDAARTGIGRAFGASVENVTVDFPESRRLSLSLRRLKDIDDTTVTIDYSIYVPSEKASPTTAQQARAVKADQVFQSIQTDIKVAKGDSFKFAVNPSHSMLVETVSCSPLPAATYDSSCDAFVAEAFDPTNMACSGGEFSWSEGALTSLCNCPHKLWIIARLDHDIKCGLTSRGKQCQSSGKAPSVPGKTFGSSILQCPTEYQDVKAAEQFIGVTTTTTTTSTRTTSMDLLVSTTVVTTGSNATQPRAGVVAVASSLHIQVSFSLGIVALHMLFVQ